MLKSPYLALYFAFFLGVVQSIAFFANSESGYITVPFIVVSTLFGLVGMSVERLQNENRVMQKQIEELKALLPALNDETVIEG